MGMMNLISCIVAGVCLLSSVTLSQAESSSVEPERATVTTTLSRLPSSSVAPHNDSHGDSPDDSKETEDAPADDDYPNAVDSHDPDDDSPAVGGSDDEKYPNPLQHPQDCRLGDTAAWLCNKDGVLDAEDANDLNKLLESLVKESETCLCLDVPCLYTGLPMVVVVLETIPNYQNKSRKDKEEHVHDLATSFLHNWISNGCDNGATTVVVASDRIVVTVIGQMAKSLVLDDCQKFVENATSSFFEVGQVVEGLTAMIKQYRLIVSKSHSCNSDAYLKKSIIIPIIILLALIIVAAITVTVLLIYRRRGSKDIRTEASVPLKDQQQPEKA